MRDVLTVAALFAAGSIASGCALRSSDLVSRGGAHPPEQVALSLQAQIEKTRYLAARPAAKSSESPTIEQQDAQLAAGLQLLSVSPSGERHRQVAERYRELGVLDRAYAHFGRAVAMNSRDAAAHDGLARVWRDWGFPHLGLGDAHRAVFYAPASAAARNTLGTVLQALGRQREARGAYEDAVRLEPRAAYAISNLCYLSFLQGHFDEAARVCQSALAVDPSYRAARNNLGLAHAAAGRFDLARTQFLDASDDAVGYFNIGIVHLARHDYAQAVKAFDAASRRDPKMAAARERANQARYLEHRSTRARLGDTK